MRAGTASVDITPAIGVALGGNGRRDNRSRGVHDKLYANIVVLSTETATVVFAGLDLLGILKEDVDDIKKKIRDNFSIPERNVVVTATHTHSGPNCIKIFESNYTRNEMKELDQYRNELVVKVTSGIEKALSDMFDCMAGYGNGVVEGYSFNRRAVMKDGTVKMVFEDYDPADIDHLTGPNGYPVMNVIKITDMSGTLKGVIVNYTSHPAIVCGEDWLFSRDYINALSEGLKSRYGTDITVLYTNGAQGNIVAADPYKHPFVTGFSESDRVGDGLAAGAARIIDSIGLKNEIDIRTGIRHIRFPIRKIPAETVQKAEDILKRPDSGDMLLHGLDPRVEAQGVLKLSKCGLEFEETVIQAVKLDDALIVTFPGEVFIEYGLKVMDASPVKNTMIFGLANGYVGYIPTRAAFSEGGYEIKPSFSSSKFIPDAGDILIAEVKNLLENSRFSY